MMNIQGKTALVTGASRGIGRAIALELARHGAKRLILVARNQQQLLAVATEIQTLGSEAMILPIDLTQSLEVHGAIARICRTQVPIHLLVNCAGVAYQTPFLKAHPQSIQDEITTNLIGMYTITRLVARAMVAQRQGTIVNVSSLMGKIAAPTLATYSATKFAILGFTQALRHELAPHQVRVCALLPSLTDTDMVRDFQWFRWITPMTAEQVAKALIAGLRKDQPEILVGWQSHLAVWASRIVPWLVERLVRLAAPAPLPSPPPLPHALQTEFLPPRRSMPVEQFRP